MRQTEGYSIRNMCPEDVPFVVMLEREIFSEPWSKNGFSDALAQKGNLFLTACSSDGMVVGYCGLYMAGDEGEITNVAVAKEYRRQGVAAALLTELLKQAGECATERIFLEVRVSNEAAVRLYERFRFEPCGRRKNFYRRPTEDALLMCCTVPAQEKQNEK